MKKRTEVILIVLLVILGAGWRYAFWSANVYGSDVLYHYTVVEQAIKEGKLSNDNNLALCYEGVKNGHPHGYYFLPYITGKLIGLDNAFIVLPIILGVISLLLSYILVKNLFNRKVALLTLFFLSISIASISKSFPFSWRGENIIYPFLLAALICMYKFLFEEKIIFAVGAGIISGITVWFWNGYPLVILIYFFALFICLAYKYFKKEKKFEKKLKLSVISIIVQSAVFYLIFLNSEIWEKGYIFGKNYYPFIIIGSLVLLGVLYFSHKQKTNKLLIAVLIAGVIIALFLIPYILKIAEGFGSIKPGEIAKVPELQSTKIYQYFFAFYILCISSILGLFSYIKKFDAKKALFLGLLLPSIYLVISAVRYMYIAALPIIVLSAIFLDNKKIIKKKFDIFVVITFIAMAVMLIYALFATPFYYLDNLRFNNQDPYLFIKEKTEENACILEIANLGATIEFFSKRFAYFHSLGNNEERARKAAKFLMNNNENESYNLGIENFYVLLNYADLAKINLMNLYVNNEEIGFYRVATNEEEVNESEIKEDLSFMRIVFIGNKSYINETGKGCAYIHQGDYIYLENGVCDTTIYKMLTNQEVKNFKNIYFKEGYTIYEVESTKNHEKKE